MEFEIIAKINTEIKKAVGVLKELSQDEETRLLYEAREKARLDERARVTGAFKDGRNEGLTKMAFEIAENMLKLGFNIDDIVESTGLNKEDVMKIKVDSK